MRCVAFMLCLSACVDASLGLGEECSRNSQCDQPLVCRLQACRTECASSRDCPNGSICLLEGVCRLPSESSCEDEAECPASLECIDGACTDPCAADSDCAPGGACRAGDEACTGEGCGCRVVDRRCVNDRDCESGVCVMGVCAEQCRTSRDCPFGGACMAGRCESGDAGPRPDVPVPDAPDGDGSIPDASPIATFDGVTQMAAGRSHTCATASGNLHCWGSLPPYGTRPEDGDLRPVCAPFVEGVDAVTTSFTHFCTRTGTTVQCAGQNSAGLGDGSTTMSSTLVGVPALDEVSQVVAAASSGPAGHTCAIEGGEVFCWGLNFNGQLGDGTTVGSPTPVTTGFVDAVHVSVGPAGTCAINAASELWCWGSGVPQPAEGTNVPTQIPAVTATHVGLSSAFGSMTDPFGCYVDDTNAVSCWTFGTFASAVGVSARRVAVGGGFVCALQPDATVMCWGNNQFGQTGTGMLVETIPIGSLVRTSDAPLEGVDEIVAGTAHACARTGETMWCWGDNGFGQLGGYGRVPSNVARQVRCSR